MKKRIQLVSIFLMVSLATMADVLITDFENGADGWGIIESGVGLVDNPAPTGLNLSCNTLWIGRSSGNANWGGSIYNLPTPVSGYKYAHILMYRNNTHMPNLKVYDPVGQDGSADLTPVVGIEIRPYEWQDVVFDITGLTVNFIFIMVDRSNNLQGDAMMFVDDILLSNDATPRTQPNKACGAIDEDYELVWNEDFTDGNTLDSKAWNIQTTSSPANNELQYYSERGVSIEQDPVEGKQCLVLTARKEKMGGRECTSGRVTTEKKVKFKYGMITARIWFPNTANGLWPAFWMMGDDIAEVGWPACGETDIIELGNQGGFGGYQDRYFNGASHWGPQWPDHYQAYNAVTYDYSVEDGFHTFTCIWTEEKVSMYVDKDIYPTAKPYYEMGITARGADNAPGNYFHKPNHILLNLAIGGDYPGIFDVNGVTALNDGERKMYIDWVRVYQKTGQHNIVAGSASDEIEIGTTTSIEQIESAPVCTKRIINGRMVITHGDTRYDVLGNKLY